MSNQPNRREFIGGVAGTGVTLWLGRGARADDKPIVPLARSANEKIRFACIGVGGKGQSDTADAARFGDIVAICDVDSKTLGNSGLEYEGARQFSDYRKMLEEMGDKIDAVTVSTPDHNHAAAALMAMQMGKHCFCQKPLTRTLYEARKMAEVATRKKLATQMGNQGTADTNLRRSAARLRAGLVGTVSEVHIWSNRPVWPQGQPRGAEKPVPETLNWDLWLGPAPTRPYADGYHTFSWRGWWDFGSGALGDMACHQMNMPFMALDLRSPTSVTAQSSGHNRDYFPSWSIITYEFPAIKTRPALKLVWYDGGKRPERELFDGREFESSGLLAIGDKGKLYIPGDYAGSEGVLLDGVDVGEPDFPRSPGHFEEFVRAIREGIPAMSNFPDYAGPLTETTLLGNLAIWCEGEKIGWDARRLRAKGPKELGELIKPRYRDGWKLP